MLRRWESKKLKYTINTRLIRSISHRKTTERPTYRSLALQQNLYQDDDNSVLKDHNLNIFTIYLQKCSITEISRSSRTTINLFKNPNWWEAADQLVLFKRGRGIEIRDHRVTNQLVVPRQEFNAGLRLGSPASWPLGHAASPPCRKIEWTNRVKKARKSGWSFDLSSNNEKLDL